MAKAREPFPARGWFAPMTNEDFNSHSGIFFINEIAIDDSGNLSIIEYGTSLSKKDIDFSRHAYFRQIGSGGMTVEAIAAYPSLIFEVEYMHQLVPGTPSDVKESRCINREGYTLQDYCRDYYADNEAIKGEKKKTV